MEITSIQRKLQKVLALSASPNKEEAQSAMHKAQHIMEKYNIRTISVDKNTKKTELSIVCVQGYTKKHRTWESKLAASISDCFDAEAILQREPNSWNVMFISSTSENEIIINLYKQLRRIISQMSKQYCESNKGSFVTLQKAYAFGMIETIHSRLITIYTNSPNTRELVLVKKKAIDDAVFELFGNIHKSKISIASDKKAFMRGKKDGKLINLNKSITGKAKRMIKTAT